MIHDNMNAKNYERWLKEKFIPNFSRPTSPVLSSPGHKTGCKDLKWDDAAGKSKFKAGAALLAE
jgi:hypothetical protein